MGPTYMTLFLELDLVMTRSLAKLSLVSVSQGQ